MPPEEEQVHPLEIPLEAMVMSNEAIKEWIDETNLLLQSIAIDSNNNDLERSLELQMLQSEENHQETLETLKELQPALSRVEQSIRELPETPPTDLSETNTLLATMIEEIKKKEDEIEIEIDEDTRSRLKWDKWERGETWERWPRWPKWERWNDWIDWLDWKNGKNGSPDTPSGIKKKLESLEWDDRLDAKAIKGLEKLEKTVKGIERVQDNYVFGNNTPEVTKTIVTGNINISQWSWKWLYLIDTTNWDVTITLPTAKSNTAEYSFKRISSWTYEAHIVPYGTETIDTYNVLDILFKNTNIPIVSDGSNWLIL